MLRINKGVQIYNLVILTSNVVNLSKSTINYFKNTVPEINNIIKNGFKSRSTENNNILAKGIKELDKGKNISNSNLQNKKVYSKGNKVSSVGKNLPKYNNVVEVIEDANKGNKVISLSQVEYESKEQLERFLKKHFGDMEFKNGVYVFNKSDEYSGISFRWTYSNVDSKGNEIPTIQYSKDLKNKYKVRKIKFIKKVKNSEIIK
ncbi:hypothetical protein [Pseudostreptobacillus hongkongensis]|uniref:hypothetical protein n=1 Tax=Pseudostreptobacillus hongkongensis TaxID=1162717 RepID=UPI000832107C|nr:hypothetical protein [Pseudostreptobacillus hongkongensis]